ncbi:MAG: hypothetical protein QOI59_5868 [Gammaproteobacteria bacterium]|jgi:hypothetical protein|nr:hypothetical protein [Gammaproteobacteria bacterium]
MNSNSSTTSNFLCEMRPQPPGRIDRHRHSTVRYREPFQRDPYLARQAGFFQQSCLSYLEVLEQRDNIGKSCRSPIGDFIG